MTRRPLERDFYRRDSRIVAPELLNKLLIRRDGEGGEGGEMVGRIVEVEAYAGAEDPASHAYRGETKRNRTMFGPPGHLYVYFTYGMHWCANAVCGEEGDGTAVLLRALSPIDGIEVMRTRRAKARNDHDLCSGPAKLCQAFGLTGEFDGCDLVRGDRDVVIADDGVPPPEQPGRSTRIGLSAGETEPWRWLVSGDANLSRREASRLKAL